MVRRYLYAATIALALVVFAFSFLDMTYNLSYVIPWWDSFEHALGGVCIGFFGLVLAEFFRVRRHRLLAVLAFVLSAGVAWEIMEYVSRIGGSPFMSYSIDTIKDIVLDLFGGYIAVNIGQRMHVRSI